MHPTDANRLKYGLTERDDVTGLDHTWFRKYENLSGRWTSPDPYRGSMSIENPQSFNRYLYVQNDPVNFVDPLGLDCWATVLMFWNKDGKFLGEVVTRIFCDPKITRSPIPVPRRRVPVGGVQTGIVVRPATSAQAQDRMRYDQCVTDAKERYNTRDAEINQLVESRAFGMETNGIRVASTALGVVDGAVKAKRVAVGPMGKGAARGFLLSFVINADWWLGKGIAKQRTNEKYYRDAMAECRKIPH